MEIPSDYYELLGVTKTATDDEIKTGFKEMAKKYHPDKNKSPNAEETFKKINEAKEVLLNPNKRQIYDTLGKEGLEGMPTGGGFDPFEHVGMGMWPGGGERKTAFKFDKEISLQEYFTQTTIKIKVPRDVRCEPCDATGFTDKKEHKCKDCNGTGVKVIVRRMMNSIQQIQQQCPTCRGQKFDNDAKDKMCDKCNSKGAVNSVEELDVEVPKQILSNPMTIVPEKGPWHKGKYIDLAVIFELQFSDGFTLTRDKHLLYTMHINLADTLCGMRRVINHPSGKKILIVMDEGNVINSDNIYKIPRMGFNNGIMYLNFVVHSPNTITMPNKKILNYDVLEKVLGGRYEPNYTNDIPSENIYSLDKIGKINNNPHIKEDGSDGDDDDNEDDEEGFGHGHGGFQGVHVNQCPTQ